MPKRSSKLSKKKSRKLIGGKPDRLSLASWKKLSKEEQNKHNKHKKKGKGKGDGKGDEGGKGKGREAHDVQKKKIEDLEKKLKEFKEKGSNSKPKSDYDDGGTSKGVTLKRHLKRLHGNIATVYKNVWEDCSEYPQKLTYGKLKTMADDLVVVYNNIEKGRNKCGTTRSRRRNNTSPTW